MLFKSRNPWKIPTCLLVFMLSASSAFPADSESKATVSELEVSGRKMEVWTWPAQGPRKGVILFSHGAASAPWKYEELINYWVAAGYAVYAPLHVDSTDHPQKNSFKGRASWKACPHLGKHFQEPWEKALADLAEGGSMEGEAVQQQ